MKVFIVSTGRTGTTFFGRLLNNHPEIYSVHEPDPRFRRWGGRYLRWKHQTFNKTTIRNHLPLNLILRYKFKINRILKCWGRPENIYVEADNSHVSFLPEIKWAFPESIVVQLVREPTNFIQSALNRGWFLNPSLRKMVNPVFMGEMDRDKWYDTNPFERASWYWLTCNQLIESNQPDLTLTFESVFSSPHQGFLDFFDCLGLDPLENPQRLFNNKVNSSFQIVPSYNDWKSDWKASVQDSIEYFKANYQTSDDQSTPSLTDS